MSKLIDYLPILTTAVALVFALELWRRTRSRSGTHLAWWTAGVVCYGAGTALESWIALRGNSLALNKAWYVAGAVLGAYPLAQGSVYLLLSRRTAHWTSAVTVPFALFLSISVVLSPVVAGELNPERPSGAVLGWTWIRGLTPLLNGYAALFLIGGALASAVRYRDESIKGRALGNALIALGAILPAIGGSLAKAGNVRALYVAELFGLILIFAGYRACVRTPIDTKSES